MNIQLIAEIVKHLAGQHDQKKHSTRPANTYMYKRPGEHDFGGVVLDDVNLQVMRYAHMDEEHIGNLLNFTAKTVQGAIYDTYEKLGIESPSRSGNIRPALTCLAVKAGLIDLNNLPDNPLVPDKPLSDTEKQFVTYTIAGVPSTWLAPNDIKNAKVWGSSRQNKIYRRWEVSGLPELALYAIKYGQLDVDEIIKEIASIHPVKFDPNAIQPISREAIDNLSHQSRKRYSPEQNIDVGDTSLREVDTQILGSLETLSEELPEDLDSSLGGARALLSHIYKKLGLQDNVVNTGRNRAVVWAVENNLLDLDNLPENPLAVNNPPDEWERWALNGFAVGHSGKELAPDTVEGDRNKSYWSSERISKLKRQWGLRGTNTTPEVLAYALKYNYITLDSINRRREDEGLLE